MGFSLSGTTVTQSGVDTSFAGLSGMAGVTTLDTGDGFLYYMPTLTLSVTGTLTVADPTKSTVICARVSVGGTGNYTSGSFAADGVTPLRGGSHFVAVGGSLQAPNNALGTAAMEVANGGRITLIGGTYTCGCGIYYQTGAVVREYGVRVYSQRDWGGGGSSLRVRSFSGNVVKRGCEHYDVAFDMFAVPSEFSVKAYASEYVAQYVGSLIAGGADARFAATALSNTDGGSDFHNWGAGWVELRNCAKGANLNVIITSTGTSARHCTPLFQDINLSVTNLAGVAQPNVRFRCVDAPPGNSPTTTITTQGGLKTWDFRGLQTYTGVTDAGGNASLSPVLQVWHGNPIIKNLRFTNSTATIRLVGYAVRQQDVQLVLGADTAIARDVAMVSANALTLTEAQAGALTGIAFAANGSTGGTVTISTARTVAEIWQAWRFWKGLLANVNSADSWEFDGVVLNTGAWSIVNSGTLIGGVVAAMLSNTGTVSGAATISTLLTSAANGGTVGMTGTLALTAGARWDVPAPAVLPTGSAATGARLRVVGAGAGVVDGRAFVFAAGSVFENTVGQPVTLKLKAGQQAPQLLPTAGAITTDTTVSVALGGLDPAALGSTWVLGYIKDADWQARSSGTAPATWAGWAQTSGTGNSTTLQLEGATRYQVFLRAPGYEAAASPIASIDTATQSVVTLSPVALTNSLGQSLLTLALADSGTVAMAGRFGFVVATHVLELDNQSGVQGNVSFLATLLALESQCKTPATAFATVQPVYPNAARNGFVVPAANPLQLRMTAASNAGAVLLADVSDANGDPQYARFRANPAHAWLLLPRATAAVALTSQSAADVASAVVVAARSSPLAANIVAVNSIAVRGEGTADTPWGP